MSDDIRRRVASVITRHCPNGGRLRMVLTNRDIAETLSREGLLSEQRQVDEVLLELAAVGFVWLSITGGQGQGQGQRIVVSSVMYPYGLELIA